MVLSITVILDPHYKIQLIEWVYTKLHGKDSHEMKRVWNTLNSLFNVYMDQFSHLVKTNNTLHETFNQLGTRDTIF